jgi:glycosyltransferase involved in cell wall biosynthesis
MNILFCGKTDFKYNRVRILLSGLKQLPEVNVKVLPIKKRKTFKADFKLHEAWADVIYIPPFRHADVSFIRRLTKKPLIFDPLISKYLTKAVDYGHWYKAPFKYGLDWVPFHKADLLLADTQAHLDYFKRKFGLRKKQTAVLRIGVDTNHFAPKADYVEKSNTFKVGFYGSFVPLQGVSTILGAAKLLLGETDVQFELLGTGYQYADMQKKAADEQLTNVQFSGWIDYADLPSRISSFDIALGVFGDSLKADLVIPNKLYHYAAMGKCIITKDTPGVKEIFKHEQNIYLTNNTAAEIASAIRSLKQNKSQRQTLGDAAYAHMQGCYTDKAVAQRFVEQVNGLLLLG